jgi:hypothetical protein
VKRDALGPGAATEAAVPADQLLPAAPITPGS